MPPRILPEPTPETRHFWDGCKAGELRLQRCVECDGGSYFPPRPFCPKCGMMTNIVGCPQTPEALQLDMPLQVTFARQSDDISLPLFQPAGA
jgi:hypothetical protein